MAKTNKVLTIDITNESITVLEITASAKKQTQIHNAIIFETPEDAYEDGNIKDKDKVASAIRENLNANGITNKNVIFVLSSTKVVNREVMIPAVKPGKVKEVINANSAEYFPVNIDDYVVSHSLLETVVGEDKSKQLRILAVAAPTYMVKNYYDVAAMAGLNVISIDYIGNSMLQLIKTQTSANATTMVIQLGSDSTVLNIVKGDTLLLQRTVPYGTNAAVNEVMDEKGVDAATAMTMLQNERMVTVDFDENAVTGAFRYLINNIGRVMDYYATKNPDKQIEEVYLTGDGALIRGLDGLFKIQLNIATRIMDSLYNVKFDPKIDLKIYNPVYLIAPIGAAYAPMGFEVAVGKSKKQASSGMGAVVLAVGIIGAVAGVGTTYYMKQQSVDKRDKLNSQIAAIAEIDQIVANYETAKAKYTDIYQMYRMTDNLNENALSFINGLEESVPKNMTIVNFSSNETIVNISATTKNYDEIAQFIINVKKLPCISDAFVQTIVETGDELSGEITYSITFKCVFVSMVEEENLDVVSDGSDTTETTEAAQ